MDVVVRESEPGDALYLAPRLREADKKELYGSPLSPGDALVLSAEISDQPYSIIFEGEVIGMFGVAPSAEHTNVGVVWLLGSDKIKEIWVPLIRQTPKWITKISEPYDLVCNRVHEENRLHHRWLKYMGFTFISHPTPFYEFARIT